jgi:hypothetical protein
LEEERRCQTITTTAHKQQHINISNITSTAAPNVSTQANLLTVSLESFRWQDQAPVYIFG